MTDRFFVTGIGTGIGKTIVSAILVEALQADYWKPIQSGNLDHSDSDVVRELITNTQTRIHAESYRLSLPMSPHAAASEDGVRISIENIKVPLTNRPLIIEGAGGLLVPLNSHQLVIDLPHHFSCEVLLVSQFYLGSINHSLLSLEALKNRGIRVRGIIFNGEYNRASAQAITHFGNIKTIAHIPTASTINREFVAHHAPILREALAA